MQTIKKYQRLRDVLLPIRPFVAARKLLVLVRNAVFEEFLVKHSVGGQQVVIQSAVEAEWREFSLVF